MTRLRIVVFWASAMIAVISATVAAASNDELFLAGLRDRGLYVLAEKYCRDQLAHSAMQAGERAELAVELVRTLAEHAVASPREVRSPIWQQAQQTVQQFARNHPGDGRALLVRMQGGLALVAQGELERQEAELAGGAAAQFDSSKIALRSAVAALRQLDEDIAVETRRVERSSAQVAGLDVSELTALRTNLRYQLARALRNQGLCYPADTADRINAVTQALELLGQLGQLGPDDPLAWPSRIDEIVCYESLRDFSAAERKLELLGLEQPPAKIERRLTAERIRIPLATGQIDKALDEANKTTAAADDDSAELDLASLEAYLAAWRRASERGDARQAASWEKTASEQVARIDQRHGPYWMRRAENLLGAAVASAPRVENIEALVRAAESLYRGGQRQQALATYDRAAAQAHSKGNRSRAFDLGLTAAAIENEQKNYAGATERFRKVALAMPQHPKADQAHLLAIYAAAQAAQQHKPPVLDAYTKLLEEHLRTWPKNASSVHARWWLGSLREHQRDWSAAIELLSDIPPDFPQFAGGVDATARCYHQLFAKLRQEGKSEEPLARRAAQRFEQWIVGPGGKPPDRWTAAHRSAALAAARIWLSEVPDGAVACEQVLRAAMSAAPPGPDAWQSSARALLTASLVRQGRVAEAQTTINQIAKLTPPDLLEMLQSLSDSARGIAEPQRVQIAEIQLSAIGRLASAPQQWKAQDNRRLRKLQASALVAAGRGGEALAMLEPLAKEDPRSGQIQEELAEVLMHERDPARQRQALVKWREIQAKSRPGSARWFRATYALARLELDFGNKRQAQALIKLAEATSKDLGGETMKARFDELRRQSER